MAHSYSGLFAACVVAHGINLNLLRVIKLYMNNLGFAFIFAALASVAIFLTMLPADLWAGMGDFSGFNAVYIPLIPLLAAIGFGFYALGRRR